MAIINVQADDFVRSKAPRARRSHRFIFLVLSRRCSNNNGRSIIVTRILPRRMRSLASFSQREEAIVVRGANARVYTVSHAKNSSRSSVEILTDDTRWLCIFHSTSIAVSLNFCYSPAPAYLCTARDYIELNDNICSKSLNHVPRLCCPKK